MTFAIDTGPQPWEPVVHAKGIDGAVSYRSRGADAERVHRKIVCNIQEFDDADALDAYHEAESLIIDSLWMDYPEYADAIDTAYEDHRCMLTGVYRTKKQLSALTGLPVDQETGAPVTAQSSTSEGNVKMFDIDTGDTGGSLGPWMTWTSEGSARKGFEPESWVMRGRDENGDKYENVIPGFTQKCVLDLDSIKIGWEKDGGKGQAPERRWNASIARSEPRPDDSKKPSGGYAWSQALQVRVAITTEQAVTWEQGSFGAYQAFSKLAKQIKAEHPGDARCPVVVQTGVEQRQLSNGSTSIPILEVVGWIERPQALKTAVEIETGDNAAAAAATEQQAAAPAAAGSEF